MSITKWPNKGTIEEALIGNINLIKLAFDSRNLTTKLKSRSFDEMIPAKEENNPARSTVSDILLRSSGRLTVEIEVEGMLHNYHWCEEVWNFVDRSST